MAYHFVKLWVRVLDDRPTQQLPDSSWRRFMELLALAGEYNQDGLLPPVADMAFRLRISESQMEDDLKRLTLKPHVRWNAGAERWEIVNWSKYQSPLSDAERKRLQRERQRQQAFSHEDVTDMSRNVTQTKTRQDKDKDKITDKTTDKKAADAAAAVADGLDLLFEFGLKENGRTRTLAAQPWLTRELVADVAAEAKRKGLGQGWIVTELEKGEREPELVNCRICLQQHPAGECTYLQEVGR